MSRKTTSQVRDTLRNYAYGIAQDTTSAIADFLAPRVPVGAATGMYKKFDDKNTFQVPKTRRALGGPATRIKFEGTDETFNCEPNALEISIDDAERDRAGDSDQQLEEAKIRTTVIQAALARETLVLDLAKERLAAVSGMGNWSSDTVDPVVEIDKLIAEIANATGQMPNALALGLSTWAIIKNHPKVLGRRPGANNSTCGLPDFASMLLNPGIHFRVTLLSKDVNKWGKGKDAKSIIGGDLYLFVRSANPTQFDPSFMKTFSIGNTSVEEVRQYREEGSRSDVFAIDWSEQVQVVAPVCARRITLS